MSRSSGASKGEAEGEGEGEGESGEPGEVDAESIIAAHALRCGERPAAGSGERGTP